MKRHRSLYARPVMVRGQQAPGRRCCRTIKRATTAISARASSGRPSRAYWCDCKRVWDRPGNTKEKAGYWTRRSAFVQVKQGPNIQLLPYPLVACAVPLQDIAAVSLARDLGDLRLAQRSGAYSPRPPRIASQARVAYPPGWPLGGSGAAAPRGIGWPPRVARTGLATHSLAASSDEPRVEAMLIAKWPGSTRHP